MTLPVFKTGDWSASRINGAFDSHTLPPMYLVDSLVVEVGLSHSTRRQFLVRSGRLLAAGAATAWMPNGVDASDKTTTPAWTSPLRVAVITDEISQDFDHACFVAAHEFGMQWVELRGLWNKNLLNLTSAEVGEAKGILKKYNLRVTDIASPLFKVDWPGAPVSKYSPKQDQFHADFTYDQQNEVLDKCVEAAKAFGTDRVRGFDFWRLEDQAPYRAAINTRLREGAAALAKHNIIFLLENESACNTATGAEAAKTLAAVTSPNFQLNWDPGNAAARGEIPYPNGWDLLPKNRIGHCHCKDIEMKSGGEGSEWMPIGRGIIDWTGQFRALKQSGYTLGVSLETHWNGGGTPEESSRQSWAGMKADLEKAGALS